MDQPTTQSGAVQPEHTPVRAPRGDGSPGRSALVWVALVALLVGAAGGYLGGRLSTGSDSDDDTTTVEALGASEPTVDAPDAPAAAGSAVGSAPATTFAGGAASSAADGAASFAPSSPPERLFKRTVAGAELRVSRSAGPRCSGAGCPPPQCQPIGFVSVFVVEDWDVGGGGASIWAELDGPARISGVVVSSSAPNAGGPPSSFLGGFIVQTNDSVSKVRLIGADGATLDEMAPIGGVAVVVARARTAGGAIPFPADGAAVEALDGTGRVSARMAYDGTSDDRSAECLDLMRQTGSSPPATVAPPKPALPAAGEQPADRAAAERAVRAAFEAALGGRGTDEANANIDDPDGLQEARDASAKAFPQYAEPGTVRFELDELVFTGPTRASYSYRAVVSADGMVLLSNIGTARLVDGRWLITRATMCQILPTKPPGTC